MDLDFAATKEAANACLVCESFECVCMMRTWKEEGSQLDIAPCGELRWVHMQR